MDDVSTLRDSMDDDELTVALDEMAMEVDLDENYHKLRISQHIEMHSTDIMVDYWPQPSTELQVVYNP